MFDFGEQIVAKRLRQIDAANFRRQGPPRSG